MAMTQTKEVFSLAAAEKIVVGDDGFNNILTDEDENLVIRVATIEVDREALV